MVLGRKMHVQKAKTCQGVEISRGEFPKKYNLPIVAASKIPLSAFCMHHFWNKINRRTNTYKVNENSKKID